MRIDSRRLEMLRTRAIAAVEDGEVPSCQIALGLESEVVLHETFGAAPADARYAIFSATKPIVASVIWQLMAEGKLDPSEPVSTWWPGFAENGKSAVTLEQVMMHTAGFPYAWIELSDVADRQARVEQMEAWDLEWEPGSRFEYHALSAHFVLAELITILTGQDHRAAVRARVLDPLGLDRLELGVPIDRQEDIQPLQDTGAPPSLAAIIEVLKPYRLPPPPPEAFSDLRALEDPSVRAAGLPGGGGVSDAASLALFYQALLHNPKDLWDPTILEDVTMRLRPLPQREGGWPVLRTLGLEVAGDDDTARFRIGGGGASPVTFGHGGAAGQIAWADPTTGLSFVYLNNAMDQDVVREYHRSRAMSALAFQCLSS